MQRKTVFLETFGCQMNMLDSELVGGQLRAAGYELSHKRETADVVLYNTCSVRQRAEQKVYSRLGDVKTIKRDRPDVVLGVIGCMAERDGEAMLKKFPQVDLMCGPGELDKIPLLIDNVLKTRDPQTALQGNRARRTGTLAAAEDQLEMLDLSRSMSAQDHQGSAYVRITRGCNKFCTYCVVPYTRGAEVHRPPEHIVDECRRLAEAGVIEITLLGQTVNHYRYDHGAAAQAGSEEKAQIGPGLRAFTKKEDRHNVGRRVTSFAELLKRIHDEVPAIQRLRFVTSYPRDFGDDILEVMAESPRICRYLHVPAQSGSDRMLKLMNREYTAGEYRAFVDRVRSHLAGSGGVLIAGDFIVGFPTETEQDHEATAELIRYCQFKNNFIFKYSPRPGTVAIRRFEDDVPEQVKRRRNNELLAVQAEVSRQVHQQQVGQVVHVLVEGISSKARKRNKVSDTFSEEREGVQMSGRTQGDLIVIFQGQPSLIGQIVPVRIQSAKPLTLFGELVGETAGV